MTLSASLNRDMKASTDSNPLGIPLPKMGDRVLLLGWAPDSEMVRMNQVEGMRLNQGVYETVDQIPVLEPEPDFLHVNGLTITDEQLEALYAERAWDPAMVTVVGRPSRFQAYAKVRGPWSMVGAWVAAIVVLVSLILILKSFVLGLF